MPGASRSSSARHRPAPAVAGRALLVHGLQVEQVGGGLRHQPDQRAPRRPAPPAGSTPATSTGPACACRDPAAPTAATTCPQPLRPISAVTLPARERRGRPRGPRPCGRARTVTPRAVRPASRPSTSARASGGRRAGRARGPRAARRRAPSAGAATSPASRPSSTSGGTTGESASRSRGVAHAQPAVAGAAGTIRSANGTTRSSRCSATSTVTPEVVDQPGQRGEHVLGRGRVERGGRLVEHQQPRVHRQHRADRDPLLLPARQGPQVAVAQLGDAEQVEGLLDPAAHRVGGSPSCSIP